jgi:pyridoxine kinase
MARILAISSQVVHGSVGLSVIVPALQALGHEVLALPTVLLSNHPGHPHVAGTRIAPDTLTAMIEALAANGWLTGVDAVLSGYLPTAEHVAFTAATVRKLRAAKPELPYLCDPVIGDWPKGIYIDERAAAAIRDQLLPLATMLTPNTFELGWLTGQDVRDCASAQVAIRSLPALLQTVATSVPAADPANLANVVVAGDYASVVEVAKRAGVPHGTGDLLAALICGHVLSGQSFAAANNLAVPEVERIINASTGHGHLLPNAIGTSYAGAINERPRETTSKTVV